MSGGLVMIARFASGVDAELAKGRLHVENIPAVVSTEANSGVVQLLVPEAAAETAVQILQAPVDDPAHAEERLHWATEPDELRCMICQSSFVEVNKAPLLLRLLRGIVLSIVPLPSEWFESRARRCGVCGYRWKESKGGAHDPSGIASAQQHGDRVRDGWR